MEITVTVDLETLADNATDRHSREELIQFIKDIDLKMGDWDFTLELWEHFEGLKKEHDREKAEDEAKWAALRTK